MAARRGLGHPNTKALPSSNALARPSPPLPSHLYLPLSSCINQLDPFARSACQKGNALRKNVFLSLSLSPWLSPLEHTQRRHYLSPPSSFFPGFHGETLTTNVYVHLNNTAPLSLPPSVRPSVLLPPSPRRPARHCERTNVAAQRTVINQRLNFWQRTTSPA